MPWLFDIQYWLITKFAPARWLFHHIGYLVGGRGLMRLIDDRDPDTIISTYPGVTAVLGMLRENRRLDIPVQSAITDLAGLRYWAHPGVDLHYVTHPESIEEVEKLVGPGTVEWVRPPISREFLMPRTRRDAREALDVPAHARVVLVSGGGWGIGDLEGAIRSALSGEDTLVVCITGRNEVAREKLEKSFDGNEQVRILGFTEQMSDWMAAADAMIHSTAGLTVLEAHIRGCPVVSYGFSAGHLRANNAAFERFGLAEVAGSSHELESVLRHVTRERRSPDSSFASLPSIASRALSVRPQVRPQPVWRLRTARVAAAAAVVAVLLIMMLSVVHRESPYRVVAKPIKSRIHIGKDNDSTPVVHSAQPVPAEDGLQGSHGQRRSLIGAAAGAALSAAAVAYAGPALAPVVPRIGAGLGIQLRLDRDEDVAITFDDGPHPQGTPAVLETLREAGARATFFLAGEQVLRRPALAAEIVAAGHRVELHCHRHRNQLRLSARSLLDDADRGQGGDRGGERPGGRRLPAALRDLQRRRPARGAEPRLAAGALVAVGQGLGPPGDARLDRASDDRRRQGRGHPPPPRRRLLQRAGLLGAHRGGPADHPRGARGAGAEVEAAAALNRRRERPLVAAREGFVELLRHRALWAVPGRRSAWPLALRPVGGWGRFPLQSDEKPALCGNWGTPVRFGLYGAPTNPAISSARRCGWSSGTKVLASGIWTIRALPASLGQPLGVADREEAVSRRPGEQDRQLGAAQLLAPPPACSACHADRDLLQVVA